MVLDLSSLVLSVAYSCKAYVLPQNLMCQVKKEGERRTMWTSCVLPPGLFAYDLMVQERKDLEDTLCAFVFKSRGYWSWQCGPEICQVTKLPMLPRLVLLNLRPQSKLTEKLPVCKNKGEKCIFSHSDLHLAGIL